MKWKKWCNNTLFVFILSSSSSIIFAEVSPPPSKKLFGQSTLASWVVTVSGAPAWSIGGKEETFFLQPDVKKTYSPDKTASFLGEGELFLGIQRDFNAKVQGQVGLAVLGTGNAKLSGNVWDDANADFNNFNYSYQVQHWHVAVKGKLLREIVYKLKPYVSGSLGVGFNRSKNYTNTPLIPETIAIPNFTSYTKTAFALTVGLGVERIITTHWHAGMGYEFADWGDSQLALAPGQTMGGGLFAYHLYTNSVQFNLTYLA